MSVRQSVLSKNVVRWVLMVSVLAASLAILLLLAIQYRQDVAFIKELKVQNIRSNSIPVIATAIWQFDEVLLKSHLASVTEDQDVLFAETNVLRWGASTDVIFAHGVPDEGLVYERWDIVHKPNTERSQVLGSMRIGFTANSANEDFVERFFILVLVVLPVLIVVAMSVIWLIYHMITRHIDDIVDYLKQLSFIEPTEQLQLDKHAPFSQKDELDDLVGAINSMYASLLESRNSLVKEEAERLKAVEANDAKSKFLASMSHELRTPLNSVIGFSDLLNRHENGELTSTQSRCVDHINSAGKLLLSLINDVLEYVKIEGGAVPIVINTVNMSDLIHDAISLVEEKAAARKIKISTSVDGNAMVESDVTRLTQILINLLTNAVKYNTEEGHISVEFHQRGEEGFSIVVSDTGIGIDEKYQEKIFEAFNRLGAENTSVEGTGIGLSTCKSLVEQLGGSISYHSELDVGTSFIVTLPLVHPDVTDPTLNG